MEFVGEGADEVYVLEHAQVRAIARRQLALGIPIVMAAAFIAAVSMFAAPPQPASHVPGTWSQAVFAGLNKTRTISAPSELPRNSSWRAYLFRRKPEI